MRSLFLIFNKSKVLRNVKCRNGHVFCFSCSSSSPHFPASCEAYEKFNNERNKDDALLAKWLMENTKLCPKKNCHERIEKAEGCKHISTLNIEKCRSQCFDTTFTILVVIIVKIIFICLFFFESVLSKHTFQTNPNSTTKLF